MTQNQNKKMALHKYNNSIATNCLSLNTNYIDDFDKNLLYNSMYTSKSRRTSSFSSISSIPYSTLSDQSRRSSVGSIGSEVGDSTGLTQSSLDTSTKSTTNPKRKDQSWLLLLILGA